MLLFKKFDINLYSYNEIGFVVLTVLIIVQYFYSSNAADKISCICCFNCNSDTHYVFVIILNFQEMLEFSQ